MIYDFDPKAGPMGFVCAAREFSGPQSHLSFPA